MCAARNNRLSVVNFLLDTIDDVGLDAFDTDHHTALHHAAIAGHTHVVRRLVHAGANTSTTNKVRLGFFILFKFFLFRTFRMIRSGLPGHRDVSELLFIIYFEFENVYSRCTRRAIPSVQYTGTVNYYMILIDTTSYEIYRPKLDGVIIRTGIGMCRPQ